MTTLLLLENWLSPALVRGVGYALLHSVWQGGVLALLLAGVLPLLRRHRAEVRYAVAASALGTLLVAVALTFSFYYQHQSAAMATQGVAASPAASVIELEPATSPALPATSAEPPASAAPATPLSWVQANSSKIDAYLPLVVIAWLLGLLLMSGRLAGGLLYTSHLRRAGTQALGAEWQQRLAVLARRAGLRRPVALLESARVAGPLVLGHLRPAILLPLGAVAGLSPALLEALLAHELAHIVRRDYLLNLGLAVAEALFFYHPAVWFMAGCLRAERENCCDDQAAALCGGDRLRVARALAALAELEAAPVAVPRLALAAAGVGGRGSLLARVRRLALARPSAPTLGEGLLAGVLAALGLLGLGTGVALAAPAGSLLAKQKEAVKFEQQALSSLTDTAGKLLAAEVPLTNLARWGAAQAEPRLLVEPRLRVYSPAQTGPRPRRGGASTVVIEKDKKGRVVSLTVDGQPVEGATDKRGKKKAKHGKTAQTVEIVQVPSPSTFERFERPERLELREPQGFSFNFSTDAVAAQAQRAARRGLADALRNPDLTTQERREIERALRNLKRDVHINVQALIENDPNLARRRVFHYDINGNGRASADAAARQAERAADRAAEQADRDAAQAERAADRAAEQAERDAAQADRDADQADQAERAGDQAARAGNRAEAAARRAELRARIAAAEAELRALDGRSGRRLPRVPQAPAAPLAPLPPVAAPQVPTPPPPPAAPNTARLREALRSDGLIDDEKHFSFELNDEGGRVNGQALTEAQVAKYRRLLNQPATKSRGSKSNFSISVDEQ